MKKGFSKSALVSALTMAGALAAAPMVSTANAQGAPAITISPTIPAVIPGGTQNATLADGAAFAWQEFIALNWVTLPQTGANGTRSIADTTRKFGSDTSSESVVWETYRSKVEIFPGIGNPPGYVNDTSTSFGYDALLSYNYGTRSMTGGLQNNPGGTVSALPACTGQSSVTTPAFVNLDETSQIGEDTMYAGIVPSAATTDNANPQLIRFLAKGNRTFYEYIATNDFWYKGQDYVTATGNFATAASSNSFPPAAPTVQLPAGTILVKATWRVLASTESASDFHTKTVRYYEDNGSGSPCWFEKTWALLGLHIIQKTPTAPTFVFATFDHYNNLLTAGGASVEDQNGAEVGTPPADPTSPTVSYWDADGKFYSPAYPKGTTSVAPPTGKTLPIVTAGSPYCDVAASTTPSANARLYYKNVAFGAGNQLPTSGDANKGICVNKRYFAIPAAIQAANKSAHAALKTYGAPSLWQNYKLVNVQWQPFDASDIDTTGANTSRLASTYALANSVIETDNTLQQFFGGLTGIGLKSMYEGGVTTGGTAYNVYRTPASGSHFDRNVMGGCMGCHGRAQRGGFDFSFTLRGGPVAAPEFPAGADNARLTALRATLSGSQ